MFDSFGLGYKLISDDEDEDKEAYKERVLTGANTLNGFRWDVSSRLLPLGEIILRGAGLPLPSSCLLLFAILRFASLSCKSCKKGPFPLYCWGEGILLFFAKKLGWSSLYFIITVLLSLCTNYIYISLYIYLCKERKIEMKKSMKNKIVCRRGFVGKEACFSTCFAVCFAPCLWRRQADIPAFWSWTNLSNRPEWERAVNIDMMMNMEILLWANENGESEADSYATKVEA